MGNGRSSSHTLWYTSAGDSTCFCLPLNHPNTAHSTVLCFNHVPCCTNDRQTPKRRGADHQWITQLSKIEQDNCAKQLLHFVTQLLTPKLERQRSPSRSRTHAVAAGHYPESVLVCERAAKQLLADRTKVSGTAIRRL